MKDVYIVRGRSDVFQDIRSKLAKWAIDNTSNFINHNYEDVTGLNDRAQDNWEPLFAIANLVSDDWYELAKSSAIELSGCNQETPSIGEELLSDVVTILNAHEDDRITTEELIAQLCNDDEKPWLTFNKGKRISPSQLSNKLKPFNIKPSTIRFDDKTKKGYYHMDFMDVIERYVPLSSTEA
ncbi:DUF3631 domain-containing protein [Thalassotalea insulae]|uniref:DUF3631 domain-containing protein n=1 Tax=Thalassotalea insulae TaxID=2056778 RepID=UPI0032B015FA